MRLRSFAHRRPPAALVVSFISLFVSLGGAGYAAMRLPANSVGSAQLRPNSVGPHKIARGSIGARQVNPTQVQRRVTGPCIDGAIQSIAMLGNVTCTPVLPNEYSSELAPTATLGNGSSQVAALHLPAGPSGSTYLVFATADAYLTEHATGTQAVIVDCALALGPGTGSTGAVVGNFTTELDPADFGLSSVTIPLVSPMSVSSATSTITLNCSDVVEGGGAAPTATFDGTINAIQTAANT